MYKVMQFSKVLKMYLHKGKGKNVKNVISCFKKPSALGTN